MISEQHNEPLKLLGEGGLSEVFLVKDPTRAMLVALKQPKIPGSDKQKIEYYNLLNNEVNIQLSLKHPNILAVLDSKLTGQLLGSFIVLEYADAGDLFGLLEYQIQLDIMLMITIMRDITNALIYLTQERVVHADVKTENIMLKKSGGSYCAMLGDFGLAMRLPHGKNSLMLGKRSGSLNYIAPESEAIFQYSFASDIFSFGSVMYTMLARQTPYYDYTDSQIHHILRGIYKKSKEEHFSPKSYFRTGNFKQAKIDELEQNNLRPPFPNDVPTDLRNFVENCWHANPSSRWTAEALSENLASFVEAMDTRTPKIESQKETTHAIADAGSVNILTKQPSNQSIGSHRSRLFSDYSQIRVENNEAVTSASPCVIL